jgi:hypothetical protein
MTENTARNQGLEFTGIYERFTTDELMNTDFVKERNLSATYAKCLKGINENMFYSAYTANDEVYDFDCHYVE